MLVLLTLPATLLTLGLFIFVINGLLVLVRRLVHRRASTSPASGRRSFGAILYSIISWALSALLLRSQESQYARRPMTRTADRIFSFEFFPPATPEGVAKLARRRARSSRSSEPKFFSVTYRRGRLDARRTLAAVLEIQAAGTARGAAYLVHRLDPREHPRDAGDVSRPRHPASWSRCAATCRRARADAGEFRYANELVAFIRDRRPATGSTSMSRALSRNTIRRRASPREDLASFKRKIDAGANSAITQYFFNADSYYHFVDECGRALASTCRSCRASCRSRALPSWRASPTPAAREIPRWIRRKLESFGDDTRVDPRLRARRRHRPVRRPARRAARRGCTSTR